MQRKLIAVAALLMFGAMAPASFAASGSSGLAGSAPENGTVAVEGGSMKDPGNVSVPSAVRPPPPVQGSGQGGYLGQNPGATDSGSSSDELQTKSQGYGTDYEPLGQHNHHR
jgi:hypothetical protein